MSEPWKEMQIWHRYQPRWSPVHGKAGILATACDALGREIAEHNPTVHVTTANALAWVQARSNELELELRAASDDAYGQRWLYKQLIEEGRCP